MRWRADIRPIHLPPIVGEISDQSLEEYFANRQKTFEQHEEKIHD